MASTIFLIPVTNCNQLLYAFKHPFWIVLLAVRFTFVQAHSGPINIVIKLSPSFTLLFIVQIHPSLSHFMYGKTY